MNLSKYGYRPGTRNDFMAFGGASEDAQFLYVNGTNGLAAVAVYSAGDRILEIYLDHPEFGDFPGFIALAVRSKEDRFALPMAIGAKAIIDAAFEATSELDLKALGFEFN